MSRIIKGDSMGYKTFNFNLKKIKEHLAKIRGNTKKIMYLRFVEKEYLRVIRCFKSRRFTFWKDKAEDCPEYRKFHDESFRFLTLKKVKDRNALKRLISMKIGELEEGLLNIQDEISFLNKKDTKKRRRLLKWEKSKSEFAIFIRDEYNKNQDKYKSLREATDKLFNNYEFDDSNWTPEKCYNLVRKY
jgi:hypothetical protein